MGPLEGLDYGALAAFAAAALLAATGVVLVAEFLPRDRGPAAGRGIAGAVLVYGTTAVLVALGAALCVAAGAFPIAVAIIAIGLAILAAPFVVQPVPPALRASRAALVGTAAACTATIIFIL